MKKIVILLTPIMILAAVYGCSKDHDAPTFSLYAKLKSPTDVVATYDSAKDVVNVTWNMADTASVADFVLTVSDSSVFDEGEVRMFPTNTKTFVSPYKATYEAKTYVDASIDSTVMYFTVSAVYKNATYNYFVGPRATIDSALVKRKK